MTRGLFLAGGMVVGCNAIFGVDDLEVSGPPEQGGAATATVASTAMSSTGHGGATDCETCGSSVTGCETERAACAADPMCSSLAQCIDLCDDSICRTDCLEMFGSGIKALYAQYDCERCGAGCRELCKDHCGACSGMDCVECVNSGCVQMACTELWNQCAGNADCIALAMCVGDCNMDPSCEDLCANMYPGAALMLADLLLCATCSWNTCYEVCEVSMGCAP